MVSYMFSRQRVIPAKCKLIYLKEAAERNHARVLAIILAHGDGVSMEERYQALGFAAEKGNATAARELIGSSSSPGGALDVSAPHEFVKRVIRGRCLANRERLHETAVLLLEHGAEVDVRDGDEGTTALMEAARCCLGWAVELLLAWGADVNMKGGSNGMTALIAAADQGNVLVVETLLAWEGVDVNATDSWGWTALHRATRKWPFDEGWKILTVLLEKGGCDLEIRDQHDSTPLDLALESKRMGVARLLIDHGAVVDAERRTGLLHGAAEKGDIELVKDMLDHGADVNSMGYGYDLYPGLPQKDCAALDFAAAAGNVEIMRVLVARGAVLDPEPRGRRCTALHYALGSGQTEAAAWLVKQRCDITARTSSAHPWHLNFSSSGEDTTSAQFAVYGGGECFQVLLDAGYQLGSESISDLLGAVSVSSGVVSLSEDQYRMILTLGRGTVNVTGWLLRYGLSVGLAKALLKHVDVAVDINQPGHHKQRTILHGCAERGSPELAEFLLDSGAMIDPKDDDNKTPLYYVVDALNLEMVRVLLQRGANANADNLASAPLSGVLFNGSGWSLQLEGDAMRPRLGPIVETMIAHGADLNRVYADGSTLLLFIVKDRTGNDREEIMVQCLLQHGVSPDQRDGQGRTGLHIAALQGRDLCIKMLLDGGANARLRDSEGKTPAQRADGICLDILIRHMYPS